MEKINISDLSIGDWVKICVGGKPRYVKVEQIVWNSILDKWAVECNKGRFRLTINAIHPIPLTPEILEKNGFEENCGRWYNSEARMEFEQYKDGWCRTINCGEYSVYFIKYVHQLQNALRLAGVEKEIEV
jgi:hypothetical protein